jgi:hypothetical protein
MIVKGLSIEELKRCLEIVNIKYDGNVDFNTLKTEGKGIRFTLRVKNSRGKGARLSQHNGRHLINACWHVHGDLFDIILKEYPSATITTADKKVYSVNGTIMNNWIDWNLGSMMEPMYYSDACEC